MGEPKTRSIVGKPFQLNDGTMLSNNLLKLGELKAKIVTFIKTVLLP